MEKERNIKGLDGCIDSIKALAKKIDEEIYFEFNKHITVTSGYREGDPKLHGSGQAFDFDVTGLSIINISYIAYNVCFEFETQVTEFGIYAGMVDGKFKQHIHIGIGTNRDFLAYYCKHPSDVRR